MKFKLPPPVKPCVAEVVGTAFGALEACGMVLEPGGIDLKPGGPVVLTVRVTAWHAEQIAAIMGYVGSGLVSVEVPK